MRPRPSIITVCGKVMNRVPLFVSLFNLQNRGKSLSLPVPPSSPPFTLNQRAVQSTISHTDTHKLVSVPFKHTNKIKVNYCSLP